ncbi:hypothetical protein [Rosistilla oblonga]|uniref:hypothetical protein n=1 Tax=Rosistilla oblonga TaxID=2527990 RepID=UPI003A97AB1A
MKTKFVAAARTLVVVSACFVSFAMVGCGGPGRTTPADAPVEGNPADVEEMQSEEYIQGEAG